MNDTTVFEAVGGEAFFEALVDDFYAGVAADPVLRPMYPGDDLTDAKHHLRGFLVQYWGGPTRYSDERGHPRLRQRHFPFTITEVEARAWLSHMATAIGQRPDLDEAIAQQMIDYFANAAAHLVNTGS